METQVPVPNSSPRRPKILFVFVGIVVAVLFIALNVWVYRQATKESRPSLRQKTLVTPSSDATTGQIPSLNVDLITPRPTSPPTPTPTPLQGPGTYACDPYGSCNHYANPVRIGCPKTFADQACLGQCGDKSNWCPN